MIKLTLPNGWNIAIVYSHPKTTSVPPVRSTLCEIFRFHDDAGAHAEFLGEGWARCASTDNFCKATGRKLSLTRALEDTHFDREERKAVWDEFHRKWPV